MKKVQPIRNIQKIEEIKTYLLTYKSYRDYFMFVFGINSGLRISDILKLKVSDIHKKEYVKVKEQKTGKLRDVKIMDSLQQELELYIKTMKLKPSDYLFRNSRDPSKPISRIQAHRILKAAAEHVQLDEISTHTLRKTMGYHFYQRTKDIAMLMKIFNHSSESITLDYLCIDRDNLESAYDKFGGL